jgi:hypothetical protein
MSTLPDPRSRRTSNDNTADGDGNEGTHRHPDLNEEVATLSTKLINAINHQTALDDTLSATRHELETARSRIRDLESQNASQREMLAGDVWIRRSAAEADKQSIRDMVQAETNKRLETEEAKKKIEQELETLTTALFEEANKMVIRAKEEAQVRQDAIQRKNDQLKSQLADNEGLLKSQQEQLAELKRVMETMTTDRDDQTNVTAPSSPGVIAKFDSTDDDTRVALTEATIASPLHDEITPAPATSLHHLVTPVLRHDITAYDDFINLAHQSHKRAGSRISSGSMGGLASLGLGLGGSTSSSHLSNASTSSLPTANANNTRSAPQSPNTPQSSTHGTPNAQAPIPSLKETKFYKRVMAEDIEPTLRLDAAPGLSWLARRSVLTAVTEGTLVVEPVPTNTSHPTAAKPQFFPCSLCGESRKEASYLRNHRFRTNESESASRHPLCHYCLGRVRSTCGLLGFLRMVKDGHWRADDENHEKAAWEECVRLRDHMFWSRIGGGMVPATNPDSPTVDDSRSSRPSNDTMLDPTKLMATRDPDQTRATRPVFDHKAPAREPRTPPDQTDADARVSQFDNSPEVHKDAESVQQPETAEQ